ncbi:MAG: GrpB-like predicted nucleotidyltransferase (UPF0157 family) [Arenicella sp.]|jgi:GrpB-like predicted nucleotidyltransferase (UPF0157 family)
MLIQPYNPDWQRQFQLIGEVLFQALKNVEVKIEHIGSTSVPNLAVKPIIDIDIVYQKESDFTEI